MLAWNTRHLQWCTAHFSAHKEQYAPSNRQAWSTGDLSNCRPSNILRTELTDGQDMACLSGPLDSLTEWHNFRTCHWSEIMPHTQTMALLNFHGTQKPRESKSTCNHSSKLQQQWNETFSMECFNTTDSVLSCNTNSARNKDKASASRLLPNGQVCYKNSATCSVLQVKTLSLEFLPFQKECSADHKPMWWHIKDGTCWAAQWTKAIVNQAPEKPQDINSSPCMLWPLSCFCVHFSQFSTFVLRILSS